MRHRASSYQDKIEWLLAHPLVWERFPNPNRYNHEREIFETMKRKGLFGAQTRWVTVDVAGLIAEARLQRRERARDEARRAMAV